MSDSGRSEVSDYTRPSFSSMVHRHATPRRVRKYPIHVLQKVFTHWHELYTRNLLSAVKSGRAYEELGMEEPFLLASTCGSFKIAMEDSPELWSLVYVNFACSNEGLIHRLHNLLYLSRGEPLTIIFQDVNVAAYSTRWYRDMQAILAPTKARWATVAASFTSPDDLGTCWDLWPLNGPNVSDLRLWGSVEGEASRIPMRFLQGSTALERLELRNVAWVHHAGRTPMHNVAQLCIGPSVDEVLGHTTVKALCTSFPSISRLKLLAFETSDWPSHAEALPSTFQLANLTHLTVSPVMLATSLQGFQDRRVLPALMSVSVRFRPSEDSEGPLLPQLDGDDEAGERARRVQEDLAAVGEFLKVHAIRTLKLRGLDAGYEPSAVRTLLFETMITKQLANVYLEECSKHTTEYVEMVLNRLTFRASREMGRGVRSTNMGGQGVVHLLPGLQLLHVNKCEDLEVLQLPAWVRGAPKGLKDVVIRNSNIDEDKYAEAKEIIKQRR